LAANADFLAFLNSGRDPHSDRLDAAVVAPDGNLRLAAGDGSAEWNLQFRFEVPAARRFRGAATAASAPAGAAKLIKDIAETAPWILGVAIAEEL
jgi:hypothetical protein